MTEEEQRYIRELILSGSLINNTGNGATILP